MEEEAPNPMEELTEQEKSNVLLESIVELQKKILEVSVLHEKRFDRLGELMLTRLNWIEWRAGLSFESQWSNTSLQGAYKLWKLNASRQPSRDGNDREGYRGSPWLSSDEQKADEQWPDELVFASMEEIPECVKKESPHAIEMARAYRAQQLANRALTLQQEKAKQTRQAFIELKKQKDDEQAAMQAMQAMQASSSGLSPAEREQVETPVQEQAEQQAEQNEGDIEEQPWQLQP